VGATRPAECHAGHHGGFAFGDQSHILLLDSSRWEMSAKDPRFWESVRLGGGVGGVGGGALALFRAVLQGPRLSAPITVAAMGGGAAVCAALFAVEHHMELHEDK